MLRWSGKRFMKLPKALRQGEKALASQSRLVRKTDIPRARKALAIYIFQQHPPGDRFWKKSS
jgi:hypothetical protein